VSPAPAAGAPQDAAAAAAPGAASPHAPAHSATPASPLTTAIPAITSTSPLTTPLLFTLPDHHGVPHSLAEHLTHHPTLLLFYPFAFSRICGGELRELQAAIPEFEDQGIDVLAVSCDPMFALRVYAEQESFGFPLLSDFWPHGEVARAYGVFDEEKGCAGRGTFLLDRDATVRWSVVNSISEARPVSAYLEALSSLTPR
jgi:mycoredoxin-dependent peroxiredoxin